MAREPTNPPAGGAGAQRLALGGLIASILLARYLLARDSFFTQDDFIYFGDARRHGLTWDWLSTEWFGHFAPGHRLAFAVMDATPAWWTLILCLQLALLALALVALHASLELLFGRSWKLLIPVVVLGCSIVLVPPLLWPSAGLQQIPDLACTIGALWAYLRFLRSGDSRWIVVIAGLMAVGLQFYVRPLLLPVYLLAIRLLLLQRDLSPRAIGRALWDERRLWLALAAVALAYVVYYVAGDYRGDPGPAASLQTQRAFVRIEWLRNIWPAALGREVHQSADLPPADLRAEVLGQVLFAVLLVASLVRKRLAAWRGWALVGVSIASVLLLVGFGRLGVLGTGVGYDLRYITHLAWLIPLGVLFALDRRPVLELGAPAPVPARPGARRRLAGAVVVLATVAYAVSALHTAAVKEDNWFGHFARAWTDRARTTLVALDRPGAPPRVRDGTVPDYVIVAGFAPFHRVKSVLPALGRPVAFDDPRGPRYVVGPDGGLTPGRFTALWEGRAGCARGPRRLTLTLAPAIGPGDGVIVRFPAARIPPGGVPVFADLGDGFPGTTDRVLRAVRGAAPPVVDLGAGALTALAFDVPSGARLCLSRVQAGRFSAG